MSSFLNKLGITKPDDDDSKNSADGTNTADEPTPKTPSKSIKKSDDSDTEAHSTTLSDTSKDLYKALVKALNAHAGDGFDYLKFRDALHSTEKHISDEETRFTAVNASAEAMKASPDDIIDSAQNYLKILASEQDKFSGAMDTLAEETGDKEKELKKINRDMADLQNRKEALEKELEDNRDKMGHQKEDFDAAYGKMAGEIKQDISKIKKYLKN